MDACKVVALIVFGGEFGDPRYTKDPERDIVLDPDLAADALRQAGYAVTPLPDKYGGLLLHPLDDFLEAVIEVPHDPKTYGQVMDVVDAIVARYGGMCSECGPVGPDHEPFADLFSGSAPKYLN
jgi:hypothetical protein